MTGPDVYALVVVVTANGLEMRLLTKSSRAAAARDLRRRAPWLELRTCLSVVSLAPWLPEWQVGGRVVTAPAPHFSGDLEAVLRVCAAAGTREQLLGRRAPYAALVVIPESATVGDVTASLRRCNPEAVVRRFLGDLVTTAMFERARLTPRLYGHRQGQELAVSPDGRTLAASVEGRRLLVVDLETGREVSSDPGLYGGICTAAGTVGFFAWESAQTVSPMPSIPGWLVHRGPTAGPTGRVCPAEGQTAPRSSGSPVIGFRSEELFPACWDTRSAQYRELRLAALRGLGPVCPDAAGDVLACSFFRDDERGVVAVSHRGEVCWELAGRDARDLVHDPRTRRWFLSSPTPTRAELASGAPLPGGRDEILVLDARGRIVASWRFGVPVGSLALSSDGRLLAVTVDTFLAWDGVTYFEPHVLVVDVVTGLVVDRLYAPCVGFESVAFADSMVLATVSWGALRCAVVSWSWPPDEDGCIVGRPDVALWSSWPSGVGASDPPRDPGPPSAAAATP